MSSESIDSRAPTERANFSVSSDQAFVETMSSWLVSLPHDLRLLYEAAADENLDRKARELAVGAIIYVVSPNDFISADRPDSFLSYCDDCLLLRLALEEIVSADDEDTEFFKSRFPEFFDVVKDELATVKDYLGASYDWLKTKVPALIALEYKSKKVAKYIDDDEASEFLYEDGLGFRTEYEISEGGLADSFKKGAPVRDLIQRRMDEDAKNKKRA